MNGVLVNSCLVLAVEAQEAAITTVVVGPNVPDPRRKGKAVTCLSCHDAHASDQKAMLLGSPERELCIGCHAEFTR